MGVVGGRRSEEAAREVTIKIRRRSCFVAVVGAERRKEAKWRSTMGVKPRQERNRERKREGWLGSRWSRVRNETILSSRGREGRCKRVGVVFSPLRRLTSLRRDEGGSKPGAEVGRARWGPSAASCLGVVRRRGGGPLN